MSVLDAFGQNLRNLTALRGSQTSVANDLDIGRVQFQRYLRSESFPKPNLLKRICEYFGVDARILTDVLTSEQLHMIEMGRHGTVVMSPTAGPITEAINYCIPDQNYFPADTELPDGIYQVWRGSLSRNGQAYRMLIRIHTVSGARVVRGYDHAHIFRLRTRSSGRIREIRGMLLRQKIGFATLYFHSDPSRVVSMDYLEPIDFGYTPAATGISTIARSAVQDARRTVRILIFRLDDNFKEILAAGRAKPFVKWSDVPAPVLQYIEPGSETF